jgi:hypothetical protein
MGVGAGRPGAGHAGRPGAGHAGRPGAAHDRGGEVREGVCETSMGVRARMNGTVHQRELRAGSWPPRVPGHGLGLGSSRPPVQPRCMRERQRWLWAAGGVQVLPRGVYHEPSFGGWSAPGQTISSPAEFLHWRNNFRRRRPAPARPRAGRHRPGQRGREGHVRGGGATPGGPQASDRRPRALRGDPASPGPYPAPYPHEDDARRAGHASRRREPRRRFAGCCTAPLYVPPHCGLDG